MSTVPSPASSWNRHPRWRPHFLAVTIAHRLKIRVGIHRRHPVVIGIRAGFPTPSRQQLHLKNHSDRHPSPASSRDRHPRRHPHLIAITIAPLCVHTKSLPLICHPPPQCKRIAKKRGNGCMPVTMGVPHQQLFAHAADQRREIQTGYAMNRFKHITGQFGSRVWTFTKSQRKLCAMLSRWLPYRALLTRRTNGRLRLVRKRHPGSTVEPTPRMPPAPWDGDRNRKRSGGLHPKKPNPGTVSEDRPGFLGRLAS